MINLTIVQVQSEIEKHFLVLQSQFNHATPVMLKNAYLGLPLSHSKAKSEKDASQAERYWQRLMNLSLFSKRKPGKGSAQKEPSATGDPQNRMWKQSSGSGISGMTLK